MAISLPETVVLSLSQSHCFGQQASPGRHLQTAGLEMDWALALVANANAVNNEMSFMVMSGQFMVV